MSPAIWPRENPLAERLLHIDPRTGCLTDGTIADLPSLLAPGDLVIVNDGATLPASLHGTSDGGTSAGGTSERASIEARLIQELTDAPGQGRFAALLFGEGDFHTRTEDRPLPPRLPVGATITFGPDLAATITAVSPRSARLIEIAFLQEGAALWAALYRRGRPIQYAHVQEPLPFWHVQTRYAGRPVCAELPSAGRPLSWGLLLSLVRRGVRVAWVTHAAGLSSTGDPSLDAMLPLPERFEIPEETVLAVREARAGGHRIIAIGTTVARALEGATALHHGTLQAGAGVTDLRLDGMFHPRIVDGILTGMHDPTESHFDLLQAFAPRPLLARAHAHAEEQGYLCHEFGDSSLILA